MTRRPKLILVVDDEAKQRRRMSHILRRVGYEVIESRDYSEACALYQRRQDEVDMLLIDVSLPGYYGCELAKTAISTNPGVKVLLTSGNTGAEVCKFYGISPTDVHFLKKPFRDDDLAGRVRYLLETLEPQDEDASGAASA
jgi:DNA-binding NtrC family response regulator